MPQPSRVYDLESFRARAELSARRVRRAAEIREAERALRERSRKSVFLLMTEEEVERLQHAAPSLMRMK